MHTHTLNILIVSPRPGTMTKTNIPRPILRYKYPCSILQETIVSFLGHIERESFEPFPRFPRPTIIMFRRHARDNFGHSFDTNTKMCRSNSPRRAETITRNHQTQLSPHFSRRPLAEEGNVFNRRTGKSRAHG